jgi:hypothetical protein
MRWRDLRKRQCRGGMCAAAVVADASVSGVGIGLVAVAVVVYFIGGPGGRHAVSAPNRHAIGRTGPRAA